MTPTVSVVIPTHNRRELMLRTINSVLAQEDLDFEVLVVDDGSKDGTTEAVRGLNDPRIHVLRNERPVGVAAARNVGAGAACGSWIAFLDDDDLWAPDKLRLQIGASASGRSWIYAGVVEIDESGMLLGGDPPPSPEALMKGLLDSNLMPAGCSNVIVRADEFRDVGCFDTGLRHLADWDLWLRLVQSSPPACIPLPLVAYRIHAGQATLDSNGMIAEGRILEARHGANLNSIRRWLAWSHLRNGERRLAARAYAHAVLAGDLSSLGRAAVAVLHSSPTTVRRGSLPNSGPWQRGAASWLHALGGTCQS